MSTEFSKMILEQYYGKAASYNYWIGCSSGGKQGWLTRIGAWTSLAANLILFLLQGMKSIQKYPQDFDGAITGARKLLYQCSSWLLAEYYFFSCAMVATLVSS
jgi:hypothetical protein